MYRILKTSDLRLHKMVFTLVQNNCTGREVHNLLAVLFWSILHHVSAASKPYFCLVYIIAFSILQSVTFSWRT